MSTKQRVLVVVIVFAAVIWFRIPSDDWKVKVQDDAFTTGKQATLVSNKSNDGHLAILDCTTKNVRLAFGKKGRLPEGTMGVGELSVRFDQGSPIVFKNVLWKSDGDYTFAQTFATESPSELGIVLQYLKEAKHKIQIGFKGVNADSSVGNTSAEFGVEGLHDATSKFMESCKIIVKTTPIEGSSTQ